MDARTPGARIDDQTRPGRPDIGAEDARQATKTGFMRRILVVSTLLAAIALVGAWLWLSRVTPTTPNAMSAAAPAATAPQAPILQRDMQPAPGAPRPAGPQSSPPLP